MLLSAVVALLLVCLTAPFFISNLKVYDWNDELNIFVFSGGYIHRERDEGWADTHFGEMGISGIRNLSMDAGSSAVVSIWGDSHVEALQVPDSCKLSQQATNIWNENHKGRIRFFGMAQSYWSVADYVYLIPRLEKIITPVAHIIVLGEHGLKDITPDGTSFLEPNFAFIPHQKIDKRKNELLRKVDTAGCSYPFLALWQPIRALRERLSTHGLRFIPGPIVQKVELLASKDWSVPTRSLINAWYFALSKLRQTSRQPLIIVYLPEIPRLSDGEIICVDDQEGLIAKFRSICDEHEILFVDLTYKFIDGVKLNRRFARGFHNGQLSVGHLNEFGHLLTAEAICGALEKIVPLNDF